MFLSDRAIAKIPTAKRVKSGILYTKPVRFRVSEDPAVMAIAKMVVAGVDKKHELRPDYKEMVRNYGKVRADRLIEKVVRSAGSCDGIQTDMRYAGLGLFGGLAKNGSRFIFYEWSNHDVGQLRLSMTKQEARDIVSGKKKTVIFKPCRYKVRLCINPFKSRENEWVYTKDIGVWATPRENRDTDAAVAEERERYPDKFHLTIGGESYHLSVTYVVARERFHILLEVPDDLRESLRKALFKSPGWKLRHRPSFF